MARVKIILLLLSLLSTLPAYGQNAEELKSRLTQALGQERYSEALEPAQLLFDMAVKQLGEDNQEVVQLRAILAKIHWKMQNWPAAEREARAILAYLQKTRGPEHPETANAHFELGVLLQLSGDYRAAEAPLLLALEIRQRVLGPQAGDTVAVMLELASVYERLNLYDKSESLYLQALKLTEQAEGPDSFRVSRVLNDLGRFYRLLGELERAEPLYQRSLAILKKGPANPTAAATTLNNLALVYEKSGDFERAEGYYRSALATLPKEADRLDIEATTLNNLGRLYEAIGDLPNAALAHERALELIRMSLGPAHPLFAGGLNNLALVKAQQQNFDAAIELQQESLRLLQSKLGASHPDTALALANLGSTYQSSGNLEKASSTTEAALEILKNSRASHPQVAGLLNSLATIRGQLGDLETALGLFHQALELRIQRLGPHHPDTGKTLWDYALALSEAGDKNEAHALAVKAEASYRATAENVFSFASERQRFAFLERPAPLTLFLATSDAEGVLRCLLRYKGIVLDSLVEDQRLAEASKDPSIRKFAERLRSVKKRLGALSLDRGEEPEEAGALRQEKEFLERQLARAGSAGSALRDSLAVTPEQVRKALPNDSVLIELSYHRQYLGKSQWSERYGAALLHNEKEVAFVDLGEASSIDRALNVYAREVRRDGPRAETLARLHELVWRPLEERVPSETTQVIICPDGRLAFLSFAALLGPDDTFIGEKYWVTYVSSGRDLLRRQENKSGGSVVVGNPSYDFQVSRSPSSTSVFRASSASDWRSLNFTPLAHTESECRQVSKLLQTPTVLLGASASEANVRGIHDPRQLHLATHGYFLPEKKLRDPMLRAGLALAGAQTTVEARRRGDYPDSTNDGLLTAAEVGTMRLAGTEMVVLSACDTGAGEILPGQGVFGLRRGFAVAGAQSLLMTLWPVADAETAAFMVDFYRACEQQSPPLALAQTQRSWLKRLRQQQGVPAAVRLAGPFVMTHQALVTP